MTAQELADQLNGLEYGTRTPQALITQAVVDGLVIVVGASDDLIEFEGAISDEAGASDGDPILLDRRGLAPDFAALCDDEDKEGLRDYFAREKGFREITPLWCKCGDYSWTYRTEIPHVTFDVMEDGGPYCRGLVISLADL